MKPFLRWAGGKTALLPVILPTIRKVVADRGIRHYYEPFLGGGAVALALFDEPIRPALTFHLSDKNNALVSVWGAYAHLARRRLDTELGRDPDESPADRYNRIRSLFNELRLAQSPRSSDLDGLFLWLNRNCYNGLWRENRKGEFNVPWGRTSRDVDWEYLEHVMTRLWDTPRDETTPTVWVDEMDFHDLLKQPMHYDTSLVYYDPPYDRESPTGFTRYTRDDFGRDQAELLAQQFEELHRRGAALLQSNANTEWIRKRYAGFNLREVVAPRRISRNGNGRQPVTELLISNF